MHRERAVPGVGAGLDGLQLDLLVLHRPGRARPRAEPPPGRDPRRGRRGSPREGVARDHAARPERQLVGPRPRARPRAPSSASCCAPATPSTGSSGSASRARTRRTSADPVIEAMAECDAVCEHAHLPLQSGSTRDPQGDAAHVLARALPARSSTSCGPRSPTSRSAPTSSSASRARPRPTSARRSRSSRRSASTARSRSSTRRGAGTEAADDGRAGAATSVKRERIERLVEVVQRIARERNARRVGRVEEVLVEGPSRTDETLLRGRTRRNTTVNFTGDAAPGELVAVRDRGARPRRRSRGTQAVPVGAALNGRPAGLGRAAQRPRPRRPRRPRTAARRGTGAIVRADSVRAALRPRLAPSSSRSAIRTIGRPAASTRSWQADPPWRPAGRRRSHVPLLPELSARPTGVEMQRARCYGEAADPTRRRRPRRTSPFLRALPAPSSPLGDRPRSPRRRRAGVAHPLPRGQGPHGLLVVALLLPASPDVVATTTIAADYALSGQNLASRVLSRSGSPSARERPRAALLRTRVSATPHDIDGPRYCDGAARHRYGGVRCVSSASARRHARRTCSTRRPAGAA